MGFLKNVWRWKTSGVFMKAGSRPKTQTLEASVELVDRSFGFLLDQSLKNIALIMSEKSTGSVRSHGSLLLHEPPPPKCKVRYYIAQPGSDTKCKLPASSKKAILRNGRLSKNERWLSAALCFGNAVLPTRTASDGCRHACVWWIQFGYYPAYSWWLLNLAKRRGNRRISHCLNKKPALVKWCFPWNSPAQAKSLTAITITSVLVPLCYLGFLRTL